MSSDPKSIPNPPGEVAKKYSFLVVKNEFAGVGALVQLLGLALLFGFGFLGYQADRNILGQFEATGKFFMFLIIGFVLCVVCMMIGSRLAKKFSCGHCGNPVAGKDVRLCPTCQMNLR